MSIRDVLAAASSSTALAGRDVQWMYFTSSRTFTPSQDMEVNIHVLGSSGTGGAGWVATGGSNGGCNASGAGAGGYAVKRATLKAGTTYTITIGAGGANVIANTSGLRLNGNDGSPTSFVGGTLNIVANGGKGGKATASNVAALGGDGGTATGGDKNFTGGRGGNIAANSTLTNVWRATGGGALNLFGVGDCNGGDLTGTGLTSGTYQSTGGGSCAGSAASSSDNAALANSSGGLLNLLDGDTAAAVALLNRSIFGKYNTIGPSGGSGVAGNFGGSMGASAGTVGGPLFGGSGGNAANSASSVFSSGSLLGTPGGCANSQQSGGSNNARPGAVFLEILG